MHRLDEFSIQELNCLLSMQMGEHALGYSFAASGLMLPQSFELVS